MYNQMYVVVVLKLQNHSALGSNVFEIQAKFETSVLNDTKMTFNVTRP